MNILMLMSPAVYHCRDTKGVAIWKITIAKSLGRSLSKAILLPIEHPTDQNSCKRMLSKTRIMPRLSIEMGPACLLLYHLSVFPNTQQDLRMQVKVQMPILLLHKILMLRMARRSFRTTSITMMVTILAPLTENIMFKTKAATHHMEALVMAIGMCSLALLMRNMNKKRNIRIPNHSHLHLLAQRTQLIQSDTRLHLRGILSDTFIPKSLDLQRRLVQSRDAAQRSATFTTGHCLRARIVIPRDGPNATYRVIIEEWSEDCCGLVEL